MTIPPGVMPRRGDPDVQDRVGRLEREGARSRRQPRRGRRRTRAPARSQSSMSVAATRTRISASILRLADSRKTGWRGASASQASSGESSDVEERPRHAKAAVVLAQHRTACVARAPRPPAARASVRAGARPSPPHAHSSPSSARRRARRASARRPASRWRPASTRASLSPPWNGQEMRVRAGETELCEWPDERR